MSYTYLVVYAPIKLVDDEYVLDIPFTLYSQRSFYRGSEVTYNLGSVHPINKEILSIVAIDTKDFESMENFEGFLGRDKGNIKISNMFKRHYPYTKADRYRKAFPISKTEYSIIEYTRSDKDLPDDSILNFT